MMINRRLAPYDANDEVASYNTAYKPKLRPYDADARRLAHRR